MKETIQCQICHNFEIQLDESQDTDYNYGELKKMAEHLKTEHKDQKQICGICGDKANHICMFDQMFCIQHKRRCCTIINFPQPTPKYTATKDIIQDDMDLHGCGGNQD